MSKSKTKVLCIFCNQRKPRAKEDIISAWLSKELNPTGKVFTDFFTDIPGQPVTKRTEQFGNLATLKLKRVCVDCNGGWMSRLEEDTRPLLEPLIRGITTSLTPAMQRQIAAWGQLKCLTLDAYYLDTYKGVQHLPVTLSHEFCQSHQPLMNSFVTLGRCVPPKEGVMSPWGRYMSSLPATVEHPEMKIVVATFGFGHLLLQSLIGAWNAPSTTLMKFRGEDPRLIKCWPVKFDPDLVWGTSRPIPATEFRLIAGPGTRIGAAHRAP